MKRQRSWSVITFKKSCDALFPEGPLTTRQPAEYSWMLGNPTPLMKIGQSLLCTGNSTQGTKSVPKINNDHTGSMKDPRKFEFSEKGKTVISVKIQNFSKSRMMKRTSPLESSREI